MKKTFTLILGAAVLTASSATAQAQSPAPAAPPAEWTTLTLSVDIAKPADIAWQRVGGNDWCAIAKYLSIQSCTIVSGKGEVGSIRLINGTIMEIAVARESRRSRFQDAINKMAAVANAP